MVKTEIMATIPMVTPNKERKVLKRLFTIACQAKCSASVKSLKYIDGFKKFKFTEILRGVNNCVKVINTSDILHIYT